MIKTMTCQLYTYIKIHTQKHEVEIEVEVNKATKQHNLQSQDCVTEKQPKIMKIINGAKLK